ncbi:MAG: GntR family transcriptional regulator [Alphaproteobacteria bacterium]|nr:GntR family transcriptional regulator [Alphaproteobacteria bacterium]
MAMTVDDRLGLPARDPTPAYYRIYQSLRARISAGTYSVDAQIPTEDQLMDEFGVSRHTIRAAVQNLVAQGLVRRQPGRGTFVQMQEPGAAPWAARSLEDMLDRNFGDRLESHGKQLLRAGSGEEHAARQRLGTNEQVVRFFWVRSGADGPNAACDVYLTRSRADRLPADWAERLSSKRLLHLVEAYCSVKATRVRQVSSATAARPDVAARLGVAPHAPLLSLERTYFDSDGGVIEHSRILGHADRCQQVVELFRTGPRQRTRHKSM